MKNLSIIIVFLMILSFVNISCTSYDIEDDDIIIINSYNNNADSLRNNNNSNNNNNNNNNGSNSSGTGTISFGVTDVTEG